MAGTKDKFELTDLQESFVDYFLGECEFDAITACARAGYKSSSNPASRAKKVLESEAVRRAIHHRMHESTFWINEGVIIDRLFKEGMTANSASARVNALVWVGKHIGMWKEKQHSEHEGVTYNIVQYNTPEPEMIKTIEAKPEVEAAQEKAILPEGVEVLSYTEPKGVH